MANKLKEQGKKFEQMKKDLQELMKKSITDTKNTLQGKVDRLEQETLGVIRDIKKDAAEKGVDGAGSETVVAYKHRREPLWRDGLPRAQPHLVSLLNQLVVARVLIEHSPTR